MSRLTLKPIIAPLAAWLLVVNFLIVAAAQDDGDSKSTVNPAADKIKPADKEDEYYELLRLFVDTLDQIERNYAKEVSRRELMEAAIRGVMAKLDQHSNYIAPDQLDEFEKDLLSRFAGIGIRFQIVNDRPTVISPLVGTPAYRAGLMAGDRIIEVEGESTQGWTDMDVVRRLKGPAGTEVKLTVFHVHKRQIDEVKIKREMIRIETVLGFQRNDDDSWSFFGDQKQKIGYLRITTFSNRTVDEMKAALDSLMEDGMKALVLDLRFNPGGMLSSAVEVSDLLLKEGLIVSTTGRNIRAESWHAKENGTYPDFPLAILVNGASASAAEIVAACLQDHERAVIIGSRTFGKGSVQQVVELERGQSAMKLTTGSYQRPGGGNIDRATSKDGLWGVQPNEGYRIVRGRFDRQRLWQHLYARDVVGRNDAKRPEEEKRDTSEGNAAADLTPFVDMQMEKAVEYLREQLAGNSAGKR